jgi:hypothetical protein
MCGLLLSAPAVASPLFYSTGTHVTGGLDQDWLVSTGIGAFDASSFVTATSWPHGVETWISDDGSKGQNQFFTFRQYFDLTAFDASTASLQFYWGCDDVPGTGAVPFTPVFSINGGAYQGGGTCSGYAINPASSSYPGSLVTLNSGFVSGQNHIDFRVQGNFATNGMGLQFQSFTASSADTVVPEPDSVVLFGSGLVCLGLAAFLRRRACA